MALRVTVEPAAIVDYCASKLPAFKLSSVPLRTSLPATALGKIQKNVLRAEHALSRGAQAAAAT